MALQKKLLKKYFLESVAAPVKADQVARALGLKGQEEFEALRQMLDELAGEGMLERVRRDLYTLSGHGDTLRGRLQLVRRGYGFVIPDSGGRDIFVKSLNLSNAMNGDRVEVRVLEKTEHGNPEGKVERVLTRARKRFVGRLEKRRNFAVIDPVEERVFGEILVPESEARPYKNGQKLLVEVFEWGGPGGRPLANVLRALGGPEAGPAEEILLKYELPEKFPGPVLGEARQAPAEVGPEELAGREDFRGLAVFTIDPESARDFDDALSLVRLPDGGCEVGVHIADVSHYVREKSAIDQEARERALSVYLDEAYVPMLPPELSSGICSLVEDRDRLTMSLVMRFGPDGKLLTHRLTPGVIRSGHRYTYEEAQAVIEDGAAADQRLGGTVEPLRELWRLSQQRRAERLERGQLDFELPEPWLIRDVQGMVVGIARKQRLGSHRLVEEFMVSANELVAERLEAAEIPAIYRVHEEPDPEAIENMNFQLRTVDPRLVVKSRGKVPSSREIVRSLLLAEKLGLLELISPSVIQAMKRAVYSPQNVGHFGLASAAYTHFTSPIRRYPDLVVHRLLKTLLDGKRFSAHQREAMEEDLLQFCLHSSQREQQADYAERESGDLMAARFMERHVGERFQAVITAVMNFGFRVRLEEHLVDGLVHVSQLTDDYYFMREEEAVLEGRRTHKLYRLGQRLEVVLTRADLELARIDFVPADLGRAVKKAPSRGRKRKGAAG